MSLLDGFDDEPPAHVPKKTEGLVRQPRLARWAQQAHAASIIDEGSVAASHKSMKSSQREDDISHAACSCGRRSTGARQGFATFTMKT